MFGHISLITREFCKYPNLKNMILIYTFIYGTSTNLFTLKVNAMIFFIQQGQITTTQS